MNLSFTNDPKQTIIVYFHDSNFYTDQACQIPCPQLGLKSVLKRVSHYAKWMSANARNLTFDLLSFELEGDDSHRVVARPCFLEKDLNLYKLTIYPVLGLRDSNLGRSFHLLEHVQDPIVISEAEPIDEPGPRIIYVNPAFERQTGYRCSEVVGKNPRILQGEDASLEARKNIREGLAAWRTVKQEIKNRTKKGDPFFTELNISPVSDETGWWTHWISYQRDVTQEKAQRFSVDKLQQIGSIGYWSLRVSSGQTYWSPEVYRIYGIPEGTPMTSVDGISFYAPHEQSKISNYVSRCISNKEKYDDIFEFYDAQQVRKWVRACGEPIVEESGEVLEIGGVFQDVTSMQNEQQLLRNILDHTPEIIFGLDHRGYFRFVSAAWFKDLGHETSEVLGHHYTEFVAPEDHPVVQKEIDDLKSKHKENVRFEFRFIDRNNRIHWYRSSGTLLREQVDVLQFVSTNVSTEKELKDEIQSILNATNVGVWKWDASTNKLEWDESLYELYGVPKTSFTGDFETWKNCLHPEDSESAVKEVDDALSGKKNLDTSFRIITNKGEVRHIKAKGSVIRDAHGKPLIMRGVNFDRTSEANIEKLKEEEAKKSIIQSRLASIGELASGVGHEINNPLAIAIGRLYQLKDVIELSSAPEAEMLVQSIEKALQRIMNITKGLRNFSRSDSVKSDFVLVDAVSESVDFIKDIYRSNGVDLKLRFEADLDLKIYGNRSEFLQILMNLISNAKDATEGRENRLVEISVSQKMGRVSITVRDNGRGIPKHIQDKIFTPFFTTKEVGKGTGIGLSIASQLVSFMDGKISYESKENAGTTFTIDLPAVGGPLSHTEVLSDTRPRLKRERLKILLVEDELELAEVIKQMLTRLGNEIDYAPNGVEALKMITTKTYDLVLTDIRMPRMSGSELFLKVKEMTQQDMPTFIFITGGVTNDIPLENEIKTSQRLHLLRKPFSLNTLIEAMNEAL